MLAARMHRLQIGLLVEKSVAVRLLRLWNILLLHLVLDAAARLEHEVMLFRHALQAVLLRIKHGSQQ